MAEITLTLLIAAVAGVLSFAAGSAYGWRAAERDCEKRMTLVRRYLGGGELK